MKKHILTLSFLMMGLSIYAVDVTDPNDEVKKTATEKVVDNQPINDSESENEQDEALRCVVTIGEKGDSDYVRMSCWFCNCDDLADAAMESWSAVILN